MTYQEWQDLRDSSTFGIYFLQSLPDGEYLISVDSYSHVIGKPFTQDGLLFIKKNEAYVCDGEWYCSNIILEEFFTKRVLQIHPKINLDHVTNDSCSGSCSDT